MNAAEELLAFIEAVYEAAEERSLVDDERGRFMRPFVEAGRLDDLHQMLIDGSALYRKSGMAKIRALEIQESAATYPADMRVGVRNSLIAEDFGVSERTVSRALRK